MKRIIEFEIESVIPAVEDVLRGQGIPPGTEIPENIAALADRAIEIFAELCEPIGIVEDISIAQFREIHSGMGKNEMMTPVGQIFALADHLALFAITVGDAVSDKITGLFDVNEFALASLLDTAASEATERAGINVEQEYLEDMIVGAVISHESFIMRYSPGYCGWHISGQRKLFEYLQPEEIGISLTNSFLMQPIKSISGVMILGPARIHEFDMAYPFCDQCRDQGCRARINGMRKR